MSDGRRLPDWLVALGLLLLAVGAYCLSAPGRIDSIDGEIRFEVARNWLELGQPILTNPVTAGWGGVLGRDRQIYSPYGAAASVVALPLMATADPAADPLGEYRRFLFAQIGPLLGAALVPLSFLAFVAIGVPRRRAIGWALASGFATLLWPGSTTVLDQIQHAFFAFAALLLADRSRRTGQALPAALGGLAAGILVNYQEPYLLMIPGLALATWGEAATPEDRERRRARLLVFLAAAGIGVALWMKYNALRFGSPFDSGKVGHPSAHPGALGNPVVGLAALLLSPGKSVFLYSPPIILAALGWRRFAAREGSLARAVLAATLPQLLVVSTLSFFHGDWCWGPRYLIPMLPMWGLAMPFAAERRLARRLAPALVGLGLVVQLLGLSLVHERFFFERRLPTFFWYENASFYFRNSALLARPGEILRVWRSGVPPEAAEFSRCFDPRLATSFIRGVDITRAPLNWMRSYRVFWLPRPWPLWIGHLDRTKTPGPLDHPERWEAGLLLVVLAGGGLTAFAARRA